MTELHEPAALIDPDTRDDALEYWEALLKEAASQMNRAALSQRGIMEAAIKTSTARTHFIQTVRQAFGGMEDLHDDEMGRPRV